MLAQTQESQIPNNKSKLKHTWGVWNVTNPNDEYCVVDGLSKDEAEQTAKEFTNDPEMVYIDPETGVEQDGDYEARENGAISDSNSQPVVLKAPDTEPQFIGDDL